MRKYGLIGYPLEHSFSPSFFKEKFDSESIIDASYEAFQLENASEALALFNSGLLGLNVTIPYKETIIPYLDELHDSAAEIMAVNTIKNIDGHLTGYNTDRYGFDQSLMQFWSTDTIKKALILGTGGASKAIAKVLKDRKYECTFVSTSGNGMAYEALNQDIINAVSLIVHTTPMGMFPQIEQCVNFPFHCLSDQHMVYDLIYNPEKSLFLKLASAQKARIQNGLEMLKFQAQKSWEIWNVANFTT